MSGICKWIEFELYVKKFWKQYMYLKLVWSLWNWSLCLEQMYLSSKFCICKFWMSFLQIDFFSENRGMLPHDRDIAYHDREWSSTSRALLSLTVWKRLGRSRATSRSWPLIITIVTMITINHHDRDCCKADSGVLTTVAHDRDDSLPARDQVKIFGF